MTIHSRTRWVALPALLFATAVSGLAEAQVAQCEDLPNRPNPIYGGGGSAVTATLGNIARALANPELGDERVSIYYWDPGACTGYNGLVKPNGVTRLFKYWTYDAAAPITCEASEDLIEFAHMGNTPLLCPGGDDVPAGFQKFSAPVQSINFITHRQSNQDAISAEAIYHIFGFGPGATGRSVDPWLNPAAVYGRSVNSFVHQIIAGAVGVPASNFKLPPGAPPAGNFPSENRQTVLLVSQVATPSQGLGYVSGSAADEGESNGEIKTLAYQHFDQSCAYLPDSSPTRKDKANVRSGQYFLWTPAWLYAKSSGRSELLDKLIGWFDGSLASPDGLTLTVNKAPPEATPILKTLNSITDIFIDSGDIPLCAMHAIRPDGDLSPIQSYAPAQPCNGYFEYVAIGSTDYASCTEDSECTGENEKCFSGFCEVTYATSAE